MPKTKIVKKTQIEKVKAVKVHVEGVIADGEAHKKDSIVHEPGIQLKAAADDHNNHKASWVDVDKEITKEIEEPDEE